MLQTFLSNDLKHGQSLTPNIALRAPACTVLFLFELQPYHERVEASHARLKQPLEAQGEGFGLRAARMEPVEGHEDLAEGNRCAGNTCYIDVLSDDLIVIRYYATKS